MNTVADLLLSPLGLILTVLFIGAALVVDHLERHHP